MTPKPPSLLVGPQQAAQLLAVSESTIFRLIRRGKLKAIRVGRQWRIDRRDLKTGAAFN